MTLKIDPVDRAIIRLLMEDGRMPVAEMARRIADVSERVAHYRIDRLLQQGVIHVSAIVDPRAVGFTVRADAFINVESGCISAVAERLVEFEEVSFVACSFGEYDVSITVHARDNTELYTFLAEVVANVPGVRATTVILVPVFLKDVYHWYIPDLQAPRSDDVPARKTFFLPSQVPICKIDRLDQAIVHLLMEDGRMSAAEIARRIGGVSARSVRDRVDSLIRCGVICVGAIVNPEAVGFPVRADVFIEVESQHVLDVAQRLTELEETSYVACSIGGADLSIQLCTRDNKELYRFVTEVLHRVPGVTKTVTTLVPLVLKDVYDWRIPDSACVDGNK